VNCCVNPAGTEGLLGVTWQDESVADVTVRLVLPEMLPTVAVMVLLPVPAELASPFEPAALLMVATAVLEEDHVAVLVRDCVEPSE
jgi:hypothetical protein